jgi:hypothetical protein
LILRCAPSPYDRHDSSVFDNQAFAAIRRLCGSN